MSRQKSNDWEQCGICGGYVLKSAWEKHLREFHGVPSVGSMSGKRHLDQFTERNSNSCSAMNPTETGSNYNPKERAECPVCGVVFVAAVLERHIQNAHGFSNEPSRNSYKKRAILQSKEARTMSEDKWIYSRTVSHCCGSRSIVVLSRTGGFVTQNCLNCGKPMAIRQEEFPRRRCDRCQGEMSVLVLNKNYAYKCQRCGKTLMVPDLVPKWEDRFDYHGYAILGVDN